MKLVRCLGHCGKGDEPRSPISVPLLTSCVTLLNFSQPVFLFVKWGVVLTCGLVRLERESLWEGQDKSEIICKY